MSNQNHKLCIDAHREAVYLQLLKLQDERPSVGGGRKELLWCSEEQWAVLTERAPLLTSDNPLLSDGPAPPQHWARLLVWGCGTLRSSAAVYWTSALWRPQEKLHLLVCLGLKRLTQAEVKGWSDLKCLQPRWGLIHISFCDQHSWDLFHFHL